MAMLKWSLQNSTMRSKSCRFENAARYRPFLELALHRVGVGRKQRRRALREQRIPRGDGCVDRAVVNPGVVHLVVEPLLVARLSHVEHIAVCQAEGCPAHEAQFDVGPGVWRGDEIG